MGRFNSKKSSDQLEAYSTLNSELFGGKKEYADIRDFNRKDLFNRYFKYRVTSHDLDHTHYSNVLTEDYDFEQKAWFAFAFGMTYRTPQAFAYTETFKYITEVDLKELEQWHANNWKRTTYGTDARYNKGHFYAQTVSLLKWLDGKTFRQKLDSILVFDTERENFYALFQEIQTLYKFGRMTGWLAIQALYDILKLPIDPNEIMLEGYSPNNDSSLQSIWNGLCALEYTPEKMVGKYGNYEVTEKDTQHGREALLQHTKDAEEFSGFKVDSFRCESIYCQFKRLFGENGSKEYAGHATGDCVSRYMYYRDEWPEINWSKFRKALRSQPGVLKGMTFVDWFNQVYGDTGIMMNMHELFPDMPNGYELMEIDPNKYKIKEIWTDDNLPVEIYDPSKPTWNSDIITTNQWYTKL